MMKEQCFIVHIEMKNLVTYMMVKTSATRPTKAASPIVHLPAIYSSRNGTKHCHNGAGFNDLCSTSESLIYKLLRCRQRMAHYF